MFNLDFHQKIYTVLNSLNPDFLAECHAYFGGGTLLSLKHGEYRLSKDIDFICSLRSGYRLLRHEIADHGYNAIFATLDKISLPAEIQANQYGVRFLLFVDKSPIKFEIISEGRIELGSPDYPSWSPVACLNETDCFAEKLLSNSDRWLDASVESRDLIDLSIQRLTAPIPQEAIDKAENAYPVIKPLKKAIQNFQDNPDYRDKCFSSLGVDAPERIIDGLDLLASDFGIEPTMRTFKETRWELFEDKQVQGGEQAERSFSQSPQALWEKYSAGIDPQRPVKRTKNVIRAALQDKHSSETIAKILESDPQVQKIHQQQGKEQAQEYVKKLLRSVSPNNQQSSQPQQEKQNRREPEQGLGL